MKGEKGEFYRLAASLAVVVVGLSCRAAVDKLLAQAGQGPLVAAWAQLLSAAEMVTGVCSAGIGAGLTVLVAARPQEAPAVLGAALRLGISASAAVALAIFALLPFLPAGLLPASPSLLGFAVLAGGGAVFSSLAASLWSGQQRQGRVLLLALLSGGLAISAAAGGHLPLMAAAHGLPGIILAVRLIPFAAVKGRACEAARRDLGRYLAVGIAIGIASPAGAFASRTFIAQSLGWHQAGVFQALWRSSDWVTNLAAGVLSLYFLPRLALAAKGDGLGAALKRAGLKILVPSGLALSLLAIHQREMLLFLYGEGFFSSNAAAFLFYGGTFVRIASWLPMFGLYALGRPRILIAGELLSLPLFAFLLWLSASGLTLERTALAWLCSYLLYALFNTAALLWARRSLVSRPSRNRLPEEDR